MKNEVENRNVNCLFHFTKLVNLHSILIKGIVPRVTLEDWNENYESNDNFRFDGQKDASCLSISHPQYKMLNRVMRASPHQEWVILALKPEILWKKDCAFCHENAANETVTSISIEKRKGLSAFNKMFEPISGKPNRKLLGLPEFCPTDPQAEVLIFDIIEPKYISAIVTANKSIKEGITKIYPALTCSYDLSFFRPRLDYMFW